MDHYFDRLAKALEDKKLSRRSAIRKFSIGLAGAVLGAIGLGKARADDDDDDDDANADPAKSVCKGNTFVCSGSSSAVACPGSAPLGCYCFGSINRKGKVKSFCGANAYCASLTTCSGGGCPKGTKCAVAQCCGVSVCLQVCKKGKRNDLPGGGSGKTAVG